MITYVLGFIFTPGGFYLIHKNRGPADVRGRWNGLGGKVEPHEAPNAAMAREAMEEGGIGAGSLDWLCFGKMGFSDPAERYAWSCWMFAAEIEDMDEPQPTTTTDEEVRWFDSAEPLPDVVRNVPMLMELARYALDSRRRKTDATFTTIEYR
jgi:8-oxo-dGTP pyrophosphatase MutT (NUDIX family)